VVETVAVTGPWSATSSGSLNTEMGGFNVTILKCIYSHHTHVFKRPRLLSANQNTNLCVCVWTLDGAEMILTP